MLKIEHPTMDLEVDFNLKIGKVRLEPSRAGYVWLYWDDTYEGMEIEESKLAACLETFYRENF